MSPTSGTPVIHPAGRPRASALMVGLFLADWPTRPLLRGRDVAFGNAGRTALAGARPA